MYIIWRFCWNHRLTKSQPYENTKIEAYNKNWDKDYKLDQLITKKNTTGNVVRISRTRKWKKKSWKYEPLFSLSPFLQGERENNNFSILGFLANNGNIEGFDQST